VFRYPSGRFSGEMLPLGAWLSISGAAFSTGTGMRTSLGLSLLPHLRDDLRTLGARVLSDPTGFGPSLRKLLAVLLQRVGRFFLCLFCLFDPALDRTFVAKDTVRLYFEVAREDGTTDVTAAIEIADAAGKVVNTAEVNVPAGSVAPMDVSIPLAELGPGGYKLSVKVSDGKLSASRAIAFVVKAPG